MANEEQVYNPYEFAKSLGFNEAECQTLANANADATNIRRVAEAKGLGDKPSIDVPQDEGKPHRHSYRKDGTCACGAVRKAKRRRA